MVTTDGGDTWWAHSDGPSGSVLEVQALDNQTAWITTTEGLFATFGGGRTGSDSNPNSAPIAAHNTGDATSRRPIHPHRAGIMSLIRKAALSTRTEPRLVRTVVSQHFASKPRPGHTGQRQPARCVAVRTARLHETRRGSGCGRYMGSGALAVSPGRSLIGSWQLRGVETTLGKKMPTGGHRLTAVMTSRIAEPRTMPVPGQVFLAWKNSRVADLCGSCLPVEPDRSQRRDVWMSGPRASCDGQLSGN